MEKELKEKIESFKSRRNELKYDIIKEIYNIFEKANTNIIETEDLELVFYADFEVSSQTIISIEKKDNDLIFENEFGVKYYLDQLYYGEEFWLLSNLA